MSRQERDPGDATAVVPIPGANTKPPVQTQATDCPASAQRFVLLEERLDIEKRNVETGVVRISKSISERQEQVDLPLRKDEVEIRRVSINRVVDKPAATRQEGEVTIVSLHQEVTVVTKQLVLTEELHIVKRTSEVHAPQEVTLRREEVSVERSGADPSMNT